MAPTKVIVIGYGTLGSSVVLGLANNKHFETSLLVKESSLADDKKKDSLDKFRAAGVHFVTGDASEPAETLAAKFAGFHTVVSTVGGYEIAKLERNLLAAAKHAGVARFVPSSFGFDLHSIGRGSPISLLDDKLDIEEAVRESGLDYVFFYTNLFTEYLFSPFSGVDLASSTVTARGSFDTKISHTSLGDIGNLVAAALADPTVTKTAIRLVSETVTYEQVAQALEKAGKKIERKVVSVDELRSQFNEPGFAGFGARFGVLFTHPGASIDVSTAWNKTSHASYHTTTIEEYAKKAVASA